MAYKDFSIPVIASVIKLSEELVEVLREVERGLASARRKGAG